MPRGPPARSGPGESQLSDSETPFPPARSHSGRADLAIYRIGFPNTKGSLGYIVTHGRPELRVEIINQLELGDQRIVMEARVFGPGAPDLARNSEALRIVRRIEVFRDTDQSALYRVTFALPPPFALAKKHRILMRFPIVVVDGWTHFETLASPVQVRRFVQELSREVGRARVEAVRHGAVDTSVLGLTASQLAVFREAMAAGYFGSPRRVTLSELARRLGRSKSTVSQQLALIQRRLAESALRLQWKPIEFPE